MPPSQDFHRRCRIPTAERDLVSDHPADGLRTAFVSVGTKHTAFGTRATHISICFRVVASSCWSKIFVFLFCPLIGFCGSHIELRLTAALAAVCQTPFRSCTLESPTRQIAINSAPDDGVVINKMREGKGNFGFDAAQGLYVDLVEAGIIDPT
jgi:hypothetical protein